jgi:hypothetical protein
MIIQKKVRYAAAGRARRIQVDARNVIYGHPTPVLVTTLNPGFRKKTLYVPVETSVELYWTDSLAATSNVNVRIIATPQVCGAYGCHRQ